MKPVPTSLLSLLLVALCGLCAWQWHRENQLREIFTTQRDQLNVLTTQRAELETRVKAADAEVLRLTASHAELRANSVAKDQHAEALQANTLLRENLLKQNSVITQQNDLITQQNAITQQANDSLKKLATERDSLAMRLNEVTATYNELMKPKAPDR